MTLPVSETRENQTKETDIKDETENLTKELDQLAEGLGTKTISEQESETSETVDETLLPELQGLEILKEGTYVVDPEKTISNMVGLVKNMESQLQGTLSLNSDLERDLDDSKEMIIDLRAQKTDLENTIQRMEEEIPSKRELQMEIEYLVDERSSAQLKIKDHKQTIEKMKLNVEQLKAAISDLEEDKKDYRVEADYLVTKLNTVLEKNKALRNRIQKHEQDKNAGLEKIGMLEKELEKADEERYRIYKELSK